VALGPHPSHRQARRACPLAFRLQRTNGASAVDFSDPASVNGSPIWAQAEFRRRRSCQALRIGQSPRHPASGGCFLQSPTHQACQCRLACY
jgi:hypothetical protein